mmetsp:Transcript_49526/g.131394  ORF Transcript_49526/g.131394 Transcript_49526/m.131394 type:complete len:237 (-) Transcript_49526:93-803(-)
MAVACRPASQCCCGCSLDFGVVTIMVLHLVFIVGFLFGFASEIVLDISIFSVDLLPFHGFVHAAWMMMGIVIVVMSVWGVLHRSEQHVRIYLWYFAITVAVDVHALFTNLAEVKCGAEEAFVCGMERAIVLSSLCTVTSTQLYCLFVVFSYCHDLSVSGGGPLLQDLPLSKDNIKKKEMYAQMDTYDAHYGNPVTMEKMAVEKYGRVHEAGIKTGFMPGAKIFGSHHDISYNHKKA